MNKKVIVQLIIIGVGIFCAYQAVSNFLNSFLYFVFALKTDDIPGPWEYFTNYLLYSIVYCILFIYLIRKNKKLADEILKTDGEVTSSTGITVNGRVVIYSILLSFTLYGILENIPFVIKYCFDWFRFKATSNQELEGMLVKQKENFITTLMYLLILTIVLYYLKPVSDYFYAKVEGQPIAEGSNKEDQQQETE